MDGGEVQPTTIYMPLLDEGVDVWRPVLAVADGVAVFRICEQEIPEDETWKFPVGSRVECKQGVSDDGSSRLFAVALAP
jgi:hypothetical protein